MGPTATPNPNPTASPNASRKRYVGEVVFLYAYDVGYELESLPAGTLLGQPVAEFSVDASKRSPRHLMFYKPRMVRLPPVERIGPYGPVRIERVVKVLSIGAISIAVRVPFAVDHVEDLVVFHDLHFNNASLHDEVRRLAEEVRNELHPHVVRPVRELAEEEAYTVFCLAAPVGSRDGSPVVAEAWFQTHRCQVASLLTQEDDPGFLSRQEADESTGRHLSYYQHDLVVIDWDAALIVDEPRHFDETLYLMELVNLQLAELEAYDRLLDVALERSYRDLARQRQRRRSEVLQEIREIRIDLTRLSDELLNISKFFGDWHLARIYASLAERFHVADWHRTIDDKLKTLGELYEILKHDQNNRWMLILEVTIVLLFVIDLVILLAGGRF